MPAEAGPRSVWSFGAAAVAGFSFVADAATLARLLLWGRRGAKQKRGRRRVSRSYGPAFAKRQVSFGAVEVGVLAISERRPSSSYGRCRCLHDVGSVGFDALLAAGRADVAWAPTRLAVLRDLFGGGGKMTAYL